MRLEPTLGWDIDKVLDTTSDILSTCVKKEG